MSSVSEQNYGTAFEMLLLIDPLTPLYWTSPDQMLPEYRAKLEAVQNGTFSRGIYMEVKMMMHPNDMGFNDTNNNTNFQLARLAEAGYTNRFEVGKHEYWPIPQDIIDLNHEMHQVRGWAN